jgi:hypothetical protein
MAVAVTAAAPGGQAGKTVPREISGVMDGRFTFEGPWAGPWTTSGDVEGTVSHLGLAQMLTTHWTDGASIWGGAFELVAANGDVISGTYTASGTLSPDWSYVVGMADLTVTGGTGRFAGASGMINAGFLETFDDASFASAGVSWSLNGTVRY